MPTAAIGADFYIGQNDLLPPLVATLKDATGAVVDLTGCTVLFKMRKAANTTVIVDTSASVGTPSAGVVTYNWAGTDTAIAGKFLAEFEVTFPSGKKETFPNNTYLIVGIKEDIS